jgi:hypothetical protein
MILAGGEKKSGDTHVTQSHPNIELRQQLQSVQVTVAARLPCQRHELTGFVCVRVRGMQSGRCHATDERHHAPWERPQAHTGKTQAGLRCKVGE